MKLFKPDRLLNSFTLKLQAIIIETSLSEYGLLVQCRRFHQRQAPPPLRRLVQNVTHFDTPCKGLQGWWGSRKFPGQGHSPLSGAFYDGRFQQVCRNARICSSGTAGTPVKAVSTPLNDRILVVSYRAALRR